MMRFPSLAVSPRGDNEGMVAFLVGCR
jgi:hypothetical protein